MLIEVLRSGAGAVPDQPLVVSPESSVTYSESLRRSEALARGLHERSLERFACAVDDVAELTALLCGSSAVGSEACAYPPHLDDAGVAENAVSFGHRDVVTDRHLSPDPARAVALDALATATGPLPPAPRDDPVMILTTGTTGRPKGARHSWTRLVEAVHADDQPGARWLLAYNLNQFAGIQVLLHVLVSRATLVVPRSRQPWDALEAIRDAEVTHASGTPTFWRLVTHMLDEESARELPLRQITLGGEAVPDSLLENVTRLFPSARISQVYASTEFGSCVSVRDGRAGLPLSVLDREGDSEVALRVVDGELQARSLVGMRGYHDQDDTDDGWRPTGDLVEVREDRLHFVGRSTDTINVGGVKVHPLPIEDVVGGVDGVELARAYGRGNPVTGEIVALDVVSRPGVETDQLRQEIQLACEALAPASRPRRIKFVDELEVRDNKIPRRRPVAER